MENSSPIERSETTQGIIEINRDNYATFSRMQQELFPYIIRKYFQTRRYHNGHAQEEEPKKPNSIKEAQPPLQTRFSKTHTTRINQLKLTNLSNPNLLTNSISQHTTICWVTPKSINNYCMNVHFYVILFNRLKFSKEHIEYIQEFKKWKFCLPPQGIITLE